MEGLRIQAMLDVCLTGGIILDEKALTEIKHIAAQMLIDSDLPQCRELLLFSALKQFLNARGVTSDWDIEPPKQQPDYEGFEDF
jgi:hypothetical protein